MYVILTQSVATRRPEFWIDWSFWNKDDEALGKFMGDAYMVSFCWFPFADLSWYQLESVVFTAALCNHCDYLVLDNSHDPNSFNFIVSFRCRYTFHSLKILTSTAAWIKSPFRRTSDHYDRYNYLNFSFFSRYNAMHSSINKNISFWVPTHVIFSIQSSEFIRSLNFWSSNLKKKKMQEKNMKYFIFT